MNQVLEYAAGLLFLLCLKRWIEGPACAYRPILEGKVVIITGANSGVGYEAAEEIARLSPKVLILACRSKQRAEDAIKKIKSAGGAEHANIVYINLDLGDLESVKTFSQEILNTYNQVDILLNNGGLTGAQVRATQKQGFEQTVGVNHLGHFLLTQNLMPLLKKSEDGRIVNVASAAYQFHKIDTGDIQLQQGYVPYKAYSYSKSMQIYFTREQSSIFQKEGTTNVSIVCLHPGTVRTDINNSMLGNKCQYYMTIISCLPFIMIFMKSVKHGAQTSLHCCLAPKDKLESGKYYENCAPCKLNMREGESKEIQDFVWKFSVESTKNYLVEPQF